MGLAPSRAAARQLVAHGHILLNGRRVTIPSMRLSLNDRIQVRLSKEKESQGKLAIFIEQWADKTAPAWLNVDKAKKEATIMTTPSLDDIGHAMNVRLIVEFYSR